tara:strand:- start:258 stop:491 length:234 start_codon:yes stop_codon:yes gene_type:complete
MTKYYDCIGAEVCVGDSVVFAEDDSKDLLLGVIKGYDEKGHINNPSEGMFEVQYGGLTYRCFSSEICYITTLNELGE